MDFIGACPKCGDENYEIEDYNDDFDQYGRAQRWKAVCTKCGQKFEITREYVLKNVTIEPIEE